MAQKFQLGQRVYSVLDAEERGMVTGILLRPGGEARYMVTWSGDISSETQHSGNELSEEPVKDFAD